MVRWNWCGRVCVIAFLLCGLGEMFAEEAAGPRTDGQTAAASKASGQDAATRGAIETVLRAQQDAWNGGDVRAFMDHYRERYPTREKMGRLTLSGLEITPLGDAAALVLGQWKLERQSEPVGGNFTLVLRKIDGRWVIVHDHTSRLAE